MVKLRTVSFLLAVLVAVCVLLPAFASVSGNAAENIEDNISSESVFEPEAEQEIQGSVPTSPFYVNGVNLPELEYVSINGTIYVAVAPFVMAIDSNAVVEELDGVLNISSVSVLEDATAEGEEVSAQEETLSLTAELGDCYVCANGRYLYVASGVPSVEGKVALPIRVLARVFNLNVEWTDNTVRMRSIEGAGAYIESGDTYYDEEILYWLSRIIFSESGNQSMLGQLAVGNVVMNRLNDPTFPDTIKGVLFQKNQFSPAMSGSIYREPGPASVIAAKLVMDGAVVLEKALFFNRVGMNTFASRNRTHVATIGAHAFFA